MLKHLGLFHKYIASSRCWPSAHRAILSYLHEYRSQRDKPKVSLYLAVGGEEEDQQAGFREIVDLIGRPEFPEVNLQSERVDDEKHSAKMIASTIVNGLRRVYAGERG